MHSGPTWPRARRQQASLAKAWASPNGQCNACLATYHNRQHLVGHLATDSPRCLFVLMSEPVGPVGTGLWGLVSTGPGIWTSGGCPAYHISDPDMGISKAGRAPGVAVGRRAVVVPTIRAQGPLSEHATRSIAEMTHAEARNFLLESDPALSSAAIDVLRSGQQAQVIQPAAAQGEQIQYTTERYPSRLFLPERYTRFASDPIPCAIRRVEYFVLNLYCGRRRAGDVQQQVEWSYYSQDYSIYVLSIILLYMQPWGI